MYIYIYINIKKQSLFEVDFFFIQHLMLFEGFSVILRSRLVLCCVMLFESQGQ